ncbi:hypothetical protein TBR22_A11160 [Luteitalea sp. TBR-22]|nr:hypothetical protein TBR22_A11160 [Luteitalea sp. TBR-22]
MRLLLPTLLASALVVSPHAARGPQSDQVARLEAMQARDPQDAVVLFHLAAHAIAADRTAEGLRWLDAVSRAPGGLDPSFSRAFRGLHGDATFEDIVARIRTRHRPLVRSTIAFRIAERDLQPEGIAFDPRTRALFVGSFKGKIVRVDRRGGVSDFAYVSRPEAPRVVVGVRVDSARRHLWAVVDDPRAFADVAIEGAALVQYDIDTGTSLATYRGAPGAFNDVVVAPNGDAYVTNTTEGSVWRASRGELTRLLPAGSISEANGITIAPEGRVLYVAGWHDIHRVDLVTRHVQPLEAPRGVVTGSFDGLYWHQGGLVGIQNGIHPGRVVRLALDASRPRVMRAEILERYHPQFGGMTTAALDGQSLLYMLNTQSRSFDATGAVRPGETLRDILIVRLPL